MHNNRKNSHQIFSIFSFLLTILLLLTACSQSGLNSSDQHEVLYQLDFENEADFSAWRVGSPGGEYLWLKNVNNGKYLFEYPSGFLESGDFNFGDVEISVEINFLVETPWEVSLACRMQPHSAGRYFFMINSDGNWSIRKSTDAEVILAEGQSTAIKQDNNILAARCVGKQLVLLVNDVELGSAEDDQLTSGGLNFSYNADVAEAGTFDNITVFDWGSSTLTADEATSQASILAIASLAPTLGSTFKPTTTPTLTTTPRPTSIPTEELMIYRTDFDDGDASLVDWKTLAYSTDQNAFVSEGFKTWTVNGYFRFQQEANMRIMEIYDKTLDTADVDIATSGTPPFEGDGGLGLVCRYSESGWYQFMVEWDGHWNIRLVKPDENGNLQFHVISSGAGKYLGMSVDLRAECKSDRLTFYIDGEKMASLYDSTFTSGKVGLLGWSFTEASERNMVDFFSVQRAQWNETGFDSPAPTPGADGTIYQTDLANPSELDLYWVKIDLGVQGVPGSPLLVGGPGQASPHTYQYINDYDPGVDVEISADIVGVVNWPRGLICRYSEDGWYEAFYMKDDQTHARVALVLSQRDEKGLATRYILDSFYPSSADSEVNLTLSCANNQISVKLNEQLVIDKVDNTFSTGRYGFFVTDNSTGAVKNVLKNYSVSPALIVKAGEVLFDEIYDTPDKMAAEFQFNLEDPQVAIVNNAIQLTPGDQAMHFYSTKKVESSEFSVTAEFQTDSAINLHCRVDSADNIGATVSSNGDWSLVRRWDQNLANGNTEAVQPGRNIITLSCKDNLVSLIANGETLASVTLADYQLTSGTNGFDVFEHSALILIDQMEVKTLQGHTVTTSQGLLNQVNLPPVYLPGETIFEWNLANFLSGCYNGWWGRDSSPCWWVRAYNRFDTEHHNDSAILVTESQQILTLFTYRPDLYNLPVEISADVSLESGSAGAALFCRASTPGRYEFYITPTGKWFIRRNEQLSYYLPQVKHLTTLANGDIENFNPESIILDAVCDGSNLIFIVNGVEIGRVQDTIFSEGQAGIFFDINSKGSFTNLTLKRPE